MSGEIAHRLRNLRTDRKAATRVQKATDELNAAIADALKGEVNVKVIVDDSGAYPRFVVELDKIY